MKKGNLSTLMIMVLVLALVFVGCAAEKSEPVSTTEKATEGTTDEKTEEATVTEDASTSEGVTLTVLANQDWISKPYIIKAWENYEAATGNTLDIQVVPIDSGETLMQTRFAIGDIPDVFMHFGGNSLKPFQPDKNFVDMSDEAWVSNLKDYALIQATFEEKVYGLPLWEGSVSGMLYNKEIFADLGIEIPTTEAEFIAACEVIKANGIAPIYMAYKDVWPIFPQFALDPVMKDTAILKGLNSNTITYADIPEVTSMMEFYKMIADEGYLGDNFTTNTFDGQAKALGEGDYAMVYCWDTWIATDLDAKYPGASDKFGIMPIFMGTIDEGTYEGPNACLTYVTKGGDNEAAAVEFVRFLAEESNLDLAYEGEATQTYFKSVTTNIPSPQYEEAKASIDKLINPSLAWSSIIGFSQVEGVKPIQGVMVDAISVEEGIMLMDEERIKTAQAQQVEGF